MKSCHGSNDILCFSDPDDEDYQKNLRRPADVKEDMKQMEDRSRVSLILNSEAFRRELEDLIDEQIRAGNHPASLLALQQISNLLVPNAKFSQQGTLNKGSKYRSKTIILCMLGNSCMLFGCLLIVFK